jgi:acetate---CoA ligase (ADP-forming)
VAVFSIPGGTRAMTVDHADARQVPLSTFSRETVVALSALLPGFGGLENPTDLTGQVLSRPELFDRCLDLIARDPNTEALVVQVANRGPRDVMERVELLGRVARDTHVPVFATFLGDALPMDDRRALRRHGVLCARDPAEATRHLGWLYRAREATGRPAPMGSAMAPLPLPASWPTMAAWLDVAAIPLPAWRVLHPGEDAARACSALRHPVAVKALPDDADHKTELGLLALDVVDPAGVEREAARIRQALGRPAPVLVQEMAGRGVEVVLAAVYNPDFGPVMAIGLGGIAIELFEDVAWLALPTDGPAVRAAIDRLRLSRVLAGFRGRPAADIDGLVDAAVRFGHAFLATSPAAREIEINPLIVLPAGQGVVAVDMLVS